jgi:hypothetical protein
VLKLKNRLVIGIALLGLFVLTLTAGAFAASPIILDGQFNDWKGQAYMSDPAEDAQKGDILNFYWATNDNDSNLYFMIERLAGEKESDTGQPVNYYLYFDINDNGDYKEKSDCYLSITYHPRQNGHVELALFRQKGGKITDYNGYWGESEQEGGSRCEFKVNMDDLGMYPGQPMRMYVVSDYGHGDRCPDSGDIQWSPIPIMPLWALITIFVVALLTGTYLIRKRMMA